jgi:hypothetical protein
MDVSQVKVSEASVNIRDFPVRAFDVRINTSDGKLILVQDREAYELDEIGTRIWQLCDGERDTDDIVRALLGDFDAPAEVLTGDVVSFVEQLRESGLIE